MGEYYYTSDPLMHNKGMFVEGCKEKIREIYEFVQNKMGKYKGFERLEGKRVQATLFFSSSTRKPGEKFLKEHKKILSKRYEVQNHSMPYEKWKNSRYKSELGKELQQEANRYFDSYTRLVPIISKEGSSGYEEVEKIYIGLGILASNNDNHGDIPFITHGQKEDRNAPFMKRTMMISD